MYVPDLHIDSIKLKTRDFSSNSALAVEISPPV
jgi:hypothetical protein